MGCACRKQQQLPHVPDEESNEAASARHIEFNTMTDTSNPAYHIYQTIDDTQVDTKDKYALVIAIDFGTTYSGYAYAYTNEENKIHLNDNWEGVANSFQFKTPTCLCITEKNDAFHSFGLEAQKNYMSAEYEDGLKLFEQFKMFLYSVQKLERNTLIQARGTYKMKALDLFAMAITFFKDHCINHIKQAARWPGMDKIFWVLTVPAIWKDSQKMFMREAAVKAGLIKDVSDDHLMIALEPEAASVYCKSEYGTAPNKGRSVPVGASIKPGKSFVVVDIGGGTTDITTYKNLEDGTVKEIDHPVGADWGGSKVNDNFHSLLEETFGSSFLRYIQKENPTAYFEMMLNFEMAKRKIAGDIKEPLSVSVCYAFGTCFEDKVKVSLTTFFQRRAERGENNGVSLSKQGHIKIAPEKVKSLFDPVIEKIVEILFDHLSQDKLKPVHTIFLVGGFGQCSYLEQRVRERFEPVRKVIKPEEAILSVLKGAVMCGLNKHLIKSRVAPRSYAILAVGGSAKIEDDFFSAVIEKGQDIPHDMVVEKYCAPEAEHQTSVIMELFAADGDIPKNKKDSNVYKVGKVTVPCPKKDGNRLVEFSFIFGGTEIKVQGINKNSGKKVEDSIAIDFMSHK